MAEVGEISRGVAREEFWHHLEKTDFENLRHVAAAIKKHADKSGFDVHLIAVGGMVDPTRREQAHKDIDLVLYCPDLAIENDYASTPQKFDKFSQFLDESLGYLKWHTQVQEAFYDDNDRWSDGSVTFSPHNGKPIEILPVRSSSLNDSLEEYLANATRPFSVIF